jgi:hypothetical protein
MIIQRIRSYPYSALTLLIFASCALINLWPTICSGRFLLSNHHTPFTAWLICVAGVMLTLAVNLIASLEEQPGHLSTAGEHRHVLAAFSLLAAGWFVQLAPVFL